MYDDSLHTKRKGSNDLVYRRERKGRFLWFGKDTATPAEQMVKECLNEAVCILEDKQESQQQYEDKMEQAIATVEDAHDE